MKKYIVIYHTPAAVMAEMGEPDPEEMKKGMEPWMAWAKRCGDQLVDLGAPLMNSAKIKKDGSTTSSSREVTGYSILEAENMDGAKSLMDNHPHLSWADGCEIEIHESAPMPG